MFLNFEHFSFLFSNKMLVFRAAIHKIIANRDDPDQTATEAV